MRRPGRINLDKRAILQFLLRKSFRYTSSLPHDPSSLRKLLESSQYIAFYVDSIESDAVEIRDQVAGFEPQLAELQQVGCKKVFQEQVSAVTVGEREELESALDYVREGDTLIVTKIDRLARSLPHLLQIIERLEKKGVALRILSMHDTSTPNGKLMLSIMGAIAEFERGLMLERQLDGIAAAKQVGKYKGRQPTAKREADKVLELAAQKLTRQEIAERRVSVLLVFTAFFLLRKRWHDFTA